MRLSLHVSLVVFVVSAPAFAQDKVTYQDHVVPIFRANCLSCHNADKNKAGLNLESFQTTMSGSSNGQVIEPGDPEFSMIYQLVTHEQEPNMPPKGKLSDKDIATIKAWITGGALEASGSAPAAPSKPKMDLALAGDDSEKPTGPPPMPLDLPLEPVTQSKRPGATIALDASPWAPLVALAGQKQILMYNPRTAALLGVLPFKEGIPSVVRFSRTGKLLMAAGGVGGQLGKVVLYDVITGKRVTEFGDETDMILAADIAPDQAFVAVGGPSRVVKIFSTENGAVRHRIKKHTEWVTAIAYSPDGVLLSSGDRNGGLYVWEAYTAQEFYNLTGHKARISDVAFRRDSNLLASASEDGTVKLWDMKTGKEIKSIKAHGGGVMSVDFTADGRVLTCGRDRSVKLWNAGGDAIRELGKTKDLALHTVFAGQDGALAITGDFAGEVKVVKTETAEEVAKLSPNPPSVDEQLAAARKQLASLEPAAKKAAETAAKAKAAADKLAGELAAAQSEQAKWKAAAFKNTVVAAEQEHAARVNEEAQAKAAVDAAAAAIAKAQADVAAAEKSLAEAPTRVKAKETDVAAKKAAHAAAVKATEPLVATVADRETLAKRAEELHKMLTAAAAASPASKPLADSASAAKTALDAVNTELATARQAADAGAEAAKKAQAEIASAEAALVAETAAIAALPQQIEQLKQAAAAATTGAELEKKQAALAAATQATAAAKARLDQLTGEYEKLRIASGLVPPPAAPTTAPATAPAAPAAVAKQ